MDKSPKLNSGFCNFTSWRLSRANNMKAERGFFTSLLASFFGVALFFGVSSCAELFRLNISMYVYNMLYVSFYRIPSLRTDASLLRTVFSLDLLFVRRPKPVMR
jgi:hypothetical protein